MKVLLTPIPYGPNARRGNGEGGAYPQRPLARTAAASIAPPPPRSRPRLLGFHIHLLDEA